MSQPEPNRSIEIKQDATGNTIVSGDGNSFVFNAAEAVAAHTPPVPLQMPPLPDHFVERPEQQNAVKAELLNETTKQGTLVVSAIYGLGGIGKSVLASKLAHDAEVQARFADGILWATLGQKPDILPLLSGWIQELGDYNYKPTAIEPASNHLRTLLYSKRVLLVVDDVWDPEHLGPFRVGSQGSCVMVTTREARIPQARRYDLDVMDAAQALALMTQKLNGALSEQAREQALVFAKRVGYLPLALELAASQVEEGVSWQDLLEDFADEVARLEGLDTYDAEEMPDDAKRRKYSLLACFNLSLKQLTAKQLRQFAWLGIVPEDVSLTQQMAQTLWQVNSREAGKLLKKFRAKALVLQGATLADGRASYRMHDLMHDLAQRLLVSPVEPEKVGELPGLGLSKAAAHGELLERYATKTRDGQWHTLKDDGYIFARLTWHMEQAGQLNAINELLCASDEDGRNGWYEACDALGKPAGFVNDLGRAWQLAVKGYGQAPGKTVSRLFRYALMRTSLNSLASNVTAEMVGGLVKAGVWQPAQGLAYAQQAKDPWHRAACTAAIVPYMPQALLPEVTKTIRQIKDATYRSYVFSKLADRFPEIWSEVLTTIRKIQDRYGFHRNQTKGFSHRSLALCMIVEKLPSQYLAEAAKIAYQIQDAIDKATALTELAKRDVEIWPEVLKITLDIKDEFERSWVLITMAQHSPEPWWPEVLSFTRKLQNEAARARVLSSIAQRIPELWPEALDITRKLENENSRAYVLSSIAQRIPELWPEALSLTREIKNKAVQANTLTSMAQNLPELWPEALRITRRIKNESSQATALSKMAQHLPEPLWPQLLNITKEIKNESSQASVLSKMAQHLPEPLWPEALRITRRIKNEASRASALSAIAQYLPEPLWPEALRITRRIKNEASRASALSAIAQHLPELWPEVLSITRKVRDEHAQASALSAIAQHLSELWPEVLSITRKVRDEHAQANALSTMIQNLPEPLWSQILSIIKEIKNESARAYALSAASQCLPESLWDEALSITLQIGNEYSRALALSDMAQRLPELWPEALISTRRIQNKQARVHRLSILAQCLPELWPEALSITREIRNEHSQASALSAMVQYLPASLWTESFNIARKIRNEYALARALHATIPNLPEMLWPEALDITRDIKDEYSRAVALSTIAHHLPGLWLEALDITREIRDEHSRANALREMAQYLSEPLWPEALDITREIRDEHSRAVALCEMAQYLPEPLWPEALDTTRDIKDESYRAVALHEMAQHLPEHLWDKSIAILHSIQDKYHKAKALQGCIPHLDTLTSTFRDFATALDTLAYQNRSDLLKLLPTLRPIIMRFGEGEETFSEVLQSVREVRKQWP